jgi:hypothetical protein
LAGTFPLVADTDGDGRQDIFVCLSGTWQVYPGQADGLLSPAINGGVSCATNPEQARVLDYDGNGRADLLYRSGTHYASRLEAAGVNVARAEAAVAKEVAAMRANMATNADVVGRLHVDDVLIEYRTRLLPDGSVSIGTIFPVK